ncbi:hypothetical protein Rhal01_03775 [Rubritalea halochordaticola]|uniref:Uncharacterized protein n=1 Tax=Rubritalea halochordaticola TaxID=714537 RepID=A0ABP9V4I1_9BACT
MRLNSSRGCWKYLCGLLVLLTTVFAIISGGRKQNVDEESVSVDSSGDAQLKQRIEGNKGSTPSVKKDGAKVAKDYLMELLTQYLSCFKSC